MPELRKDSISGEWVIIAPERYSRPAGQVSSQLSDDANDDCPFCRGHEDETPVAALTINRDGECVAGESDWLVRIVANAFPAVRPPGTSAEPSAELFGGSDFFQAAPGVGVHEVIVESPDHVCSMTQHDVPQFERIVTAWQTRLGQLAERDELRYVTLFRNSGSTAGGSVAHAHSQLLATTFVPPRIETELQAAIASRQNTGRSPWATMVEQELAAGCRIISESNHFTVFCPFASRFASEIWIVPRRPEPDFSAATPEELADLAVVLRNTLCRLDAAFDRPAFNLTVHTAPLREPGREAFHWHVEITPRLSGIAGFEISSGTWINVVAPEEAAARLRDASV